MSNERISEPQYTKNPLIDIVKKGSIITVITLISRPLGYVREAYQAYLFGATLLVDAFVVAFNFPELIQTLFFSGATSAFLVPVCVKYMEDREEFSTIYSTFMNLAIVVTLLISIPFLIFSGVIVDMIAPGFNIETRATTKYLFMIMIPVISLHTMLSVVKAFLNAREHFAAPELSGIVWNMVFILSALALNKKIGIYSLAVGVTAGSIIQLILQLPYLKRFNIRYRPVFSFRHPAVGEARRLFAGALIATSIVPINSFVGRIIASYLPQGEVASLSYAFRIFILPFSLFAVPIYTVMFSRVSRMFHERDWKGIFAHIDSSLTLLSITLLPATVFLCSLGDGCIKLLYERGAFTARETFLTNKALFGYSTGLVFYALSISFVRIFNALHDMKTPAIIGLTSIAINGILASILMVPLGNLGISMATSAVSLYNFLMLFVFLKRKTGYRLARKTTRDIMRSIIAGIILLIILFLMKYYFGEMTYLLLGAGALVTAVVFGVTFKNYYSLFLKKEI